MKALALTFCTKEFNTLARKIVAKKMGGFSAKMFAGATTYFSL